jgi:hypothetical protein
MRVSVYKLGQSCIDNLADDFERTAEWRREKAQQFLDDESRNLEAAHLFETLARQIGDLRGSDSESQLEQAIDQVDPYDRAEKTSELLREVGFHWLGNASQFVGELKRRLQKVGCVQ